MRIVNAVKIKQKNKRKVKVMQKGLIGLNSKQKTFSDFEVKIHSWLHLKRSHHKWIDFDDRTDHAYSIDLYFNECMIITAFART